jgi:hypothetical protein
MFIPVLESLGKITGATVGLQQETFKKWFSLWPAFPTVQPPAPEQMQRFQKEWGGVIQEAIKRQRELAETQFKAGTKIIETSFQIGEVKTPEELRAKGLELWKICLEVVRQTSEAQIRDFTAAFEKWVELMTPTPPPA